MSGQTIAEAPQERSRGKAAHWQKQRAKSSQSVVARNDGNALRDREICRVVEEERAAALLEAAAVKKDHGGKRTGARRGRGEHVQIQAVFGLHFGNIWVVVVLQAAGAEAARELRMSVGQMKSCCGRTRCRLWVQSTAGARLERRSGGDRQELRRRGCQGNWQHQRAV